MHDLVIRGGTIADGSGRPTFTGDIAIDGNKVVVVGTVEAKGRREIDADGLLVTPGWVDIHTHYDGQVTWDPEVSPSGWHGVTTVVTGNCGVGFAPARASDREWLIQLMEGVEDIPGSALAEGMSWNWESFPEYLDEVERGERVLDVAAMVPHGALRAFVLGEGRGNDEASAEEIAEMASLVREAVHAGAIGASTTRTILHRAKDGELAAGTYAPADELIAIGEALGKAGHRVFSLASDMMDLDGEFAWMAEISKRAGVPVTYQVLQPDFAPDLWREWVDRGVAANRQGAWLVPQVAGKPTSLMVGFESKTHPFSHHRAYADIASLPLAERVARLRTPEVRAAILAEEPTPGGFVALLLASLHKLFPLGDPPDYEPAPESAVAAVAAREGRPVMEVLYDLMLGRDGHELLYLPILDYAAGNLDAVREMLIHPATVLGLGDGGAHCGVLCDASLPTFMLTHWARDRHRGEKLPLEQVVHLQTRRTAQLYGLNDRGLLAPGYVADLNVIDHQGLTLEAPELVYDLPASGQRMIQRARGYIATVKSGTVVREHDAGTGELPGRLLRGPQPVPSGR
ncbi:MAG TPA: amidohydrolase family protein [Acidimicrobiales bacterium]|jgi:N-acyl-D-aspartate/D-glutamate deacylase|nr:amidohydrolase family protein [Acidimicrobiales bacterium]